MIYFRNPEARYRAEEFGGMVMTAKGPFALDYETYMMFVNFETREINEALSETLQNLLDIDAILSITESLAEEALKNQEM